MHESIQFNEASNEREAAETIKDLQESLPALESRRLRKPHDSFYEGLRRFSRRATAMGALFATLSGGELLLKPNQAAAGIETRLAGEITDVYHPYFEPWLVITSEGKIKLAGLYEDQKLVEKGEAMRVLVDDIMAAIAKSEQILIAKLDVSFSLSNDKNDFFINAEVDPHLGIFSIQIRSDFDVKKDKKTLEALISHELGHVRHFSVEDVKHEEIDAAWQKAREQNSEIGQKLAEVEKQIHEKEEKASPGFNEIIKKMQLLGRRMSQGNLARSEAQQLRNERESLFSKTDSAARQLAEDEEYKELLETASFHRGFLTPTFAREMIRGGGPEMVADFFMAKHAIREHWTKEELDEALKKLFDEGEEYVADIHGLDSDSRRGAILIYYDTISINPDFWLNLSITPKTIQDNIKGLYFGHT